jgi:hypothetical protein
MTTDKKIINKICSLYQGLFISMIAEELGISVNKVRYWLDKNNIPKRNRSDAGYLAYKYRFDKLPCKIKTRLDISDEKLLVAGVMLYASEGSKKEKGRVTFVNSDPKLIKLFLKFLRKICGVHEERIRITPHFYRDQDEVKLRKFWSGVTEVPLSQFCKSYIHQGKKGSYNKKSKYGTISLRYSDKRLLGQILRWIEEYLDRL